MEKINKIYMKNKKEKGVFNKFSKLSSYFTSMLKFSIAVALFFIAALFITAAGITVEDGSFNVSNNLLVNTNTLYVDSSTNRIGIGIINPGTKLEVDGTIGFETNPTGRNLRIAAAASGDTNWGLEQAAGQTFNGLGLRIYDSNNAGFYIYDENSNDYLMVIGDNNGRMGIGTTNPVAKLEVEQTADAEGLVVELTALSSSNWGVRYDNGASSDPALGVFTVGQLNTGSNTTVYNIDNRGTGDSFRVIDGGTTRIVIDDDGNVGIGTTSPNQKLMVSGNANVTGTIYYGALQANSPVLERTSEPFVAKCTTADDGNLVVEYIHEEGGSYNRLIEAVNSNSNNWYHRSCFEKNEKFDYLDTLLINNVLINETFFDEQINETIITSRDPTIEDIGFDWNTKTAFLIE